MTSVLLHVGVNVENRYFDGFIDDIRIYDRALSANEIRLLYQVESELPERSVTSAKLSSALSDLIDGNGSLEQALPAGSVIARKPGETPPPGYTLFQRPDYNASLVWEERASISIARYAFDGADVIDGKIYFTGMQGGNRFTRFDSFEKYDPSRMFGKLYLIIIGKLVTAPCTYGFGWDQYYVIGDQEGEKSVEIFDPLTEHGQRSSYAQLPFITVRQLLITVKFMWLVQIRMIVFDPVTSEWSLKAECGLVGWYNFIGLREQNLVLHW